MGPKDLGAQTGKRHGCSQIDKHAHSACRGALSPPAPPPACARTLSAGQCPSQHRRHGAHRLCKGWCCLPLRHLEARHSVLPAGWKPGPADRAPDPQPPHRPGTSVKLGSARHHTQSCCPAVLPGASGRPSCHCLWSLQKTSLSCLPAVLTHAAWSTGSQHHQLSPKLACAAAAGASAQELSPLPVRQRKLPGALPNPEWVLPTLLAGALVW